MYAQKILIFSLLFLAACEFSVKKSPKLKGYKVETIYLGKVPCPDCDYIETIIEFKKKQRYLVSRRYVGKENFIQFEDDGYYNWIADGTIVHLVNFDGPSYYKVEVERLYQLNDDLSFHSGPNAYEYVFYKNEKAYNIF